MRDADDLQTPCYVIDDGWRGGISYRDGWCYGKDRHLGATGSNPRDVIKADIRRAYDERNGIPVYKVSDHGNICRTRAVRLRSR